MEDVRMFLIDALQNIISAGTQQLQTWVTGLLPQVFLFLILLNAITRLIGRARVERLAALPVRRRARQSHGHLHGPLPAGTL